MATIARGLFRLGVLATVVWIAAVAALAASQFLSVNPFCQFDATPVSVDPRCQRYFWYWVPVTLEQLALKPHIERLLLLGFAVPVAGWLLGFGFAWVVRGFRGREVA
jgi:hypothetical protein